MNRISRILASLVAAMSIILGLSACNTGGGSGSYYDTLCVNPLTQIRQPDYYCTVGNPYYQPHWIYYVPSGYLAPAYGVHIVHYNVHSYSRPANATIHTGGVPAKGGKAPKLSTGNVHTTKNGTTQKSVTGGTKRGGTSNTKRGGGSNNVGGNSGKRGGSGGGFGGGGRRH